MPIKRLTLEPTTYWDEVQLFNENPDYEMSQK